MFECENTFELGMNPASIILHLLLSLIHSKNNTVECHQAHRLAFSLLCKPLNTITD